MNWARFTAAPGFDLIDYGNGSTTPEPFTPPSATPPPAPLSTQPADRLTLDLATGVLDNARWSGLLGVDARTGISPQDGDDLVIVNHQGNLVAAWSAMHNGNYEIYVARYNRDTSAWEEYSGGSASGRGVSNSVIQSSQPALASADDDGTPVLLLSYTETDAAGNRTVILKRSVSGGAFVTDANFPNTGIAAHSSKAIGLSDGYAVYWLDSSLPLQKIVKARYFDGSGPDPAGWTGPATINFEPLASINAFDVASNGTYNVAFAYSSGIEPIRRVKFYSGDSPSDLIYTTPVGPDSFEPTVAVETLSDREQYTLWCAWSSQDDRGSNIRGYRLRRNLDNTLEFGEVQPQFFGKTSPRVGAAGISDTVEYATRPLLAGAAFNAHLWWQDDSVRDGNPLASLMSMNSGSGAVMVERLPNDATGDGIATTPGAFSSLDADIGSDKVVSWNDAGVTHTGFAHVGTRMLRDVNFLYITATVAADNPSNIQSLLNGPTVASGVVIIEPGTYNDFTVPASAASGLTLRPRLPGTVTINGNVTINATGTTLEGLLINGGVTVAASNVTIRGNTINATGIDGIDVVAAVSGLVIADNAMTGDAKGIDLAAAADGEIVRNTIVAGTRGLDLQASFTGDVERNDISGAIVGVRWNASARLFDNDVHDNITGIEVLAGNDSDGLGAVGPNRPNRIFNNTTGISIASAAVVQRQHVHDNTTGVSGAGTLGGTTPSSFNLVENNTTGVLMDNGTVRFALVRGNGVGILAGANLLLERNLLLANCSADIRVNAVSGANVVNNTLDSAATSSIDVLAVAVASLRGNIVRNTAGVALAIADASTASALTSNYNTLHSEGPTLVRVGSTNFASLPAWRLASGEDTRSAGITANNRAWSTPRFTHAGTSDYTLLPLAAGIHSSAVAIRNGDPALNGGNPLNQGVFALTSLDTAASNPQIVIDSPLDAGAITNGQVIDLRWRSFGFTGGNVKIDLYQATPSGPQFVATLASSTPNDGQFAYTATLDLASAVFHVARESDAAVSDRSLDDIAGPAVGFAAVATNDTTPTLTGTVSDPAASVVVILNGSNYTATNLGNGNWTVDGSPLSPLADGTYDLEIVATDASGNQGRQVFPGSIRIDTVAPVVNFTAISTTDNRPPLSGMIDDPAATIAVLVNGNAYLAANNGDGTWSLPDDTITPALPDGTYAIRVLAADGVGNVVDRTFNDALLVDTAAPSIVFSPVVTRDTTPDLYLLVNDPTASVVLTLQSTPYQATRIAGSLWRVDGSQLAPLPDGVYAVSITATDPLGNANTQDHPSGLTVDTTPPAGTFTPLLTNDNRPPLAGTINDPSASIRVFINGVGFDAVNNGNGTWSIANDAVPTIPDGTYDVTVRATDPAGNRTDTPFADALTIDTSSPAVSTAVFRFEWFQQIELNFSEALVGLDADDATITNLTSGTTVTPGQYTFSGSSTVARWRFNAPLPDGNYRLTIAPGAFTDAAGNTLATAYQFDFHVLAGDANRDGVVNASDHAVLAANYAASPRSFSGGNFDYDLGGNVGIDDLVLLTKNYTPGPVAFFEPNAVTSPRFTPVSNAVRLALPGVPTGLDLADFVLVRNGGTPQPLTGASLSFIRPEAVEITGLSSFTTLAGIYTLRLNPAGWTFGTGQQIAAPAELTFRVLTVGDMNNDGFVNNQDISAFVMGLTNPSGFETAYGFDPALTGDVNGDGVFNNQDIAPFVALLTGGRPATQTTPPTITASPVVGTKVLRRTPFASGRTLDLTLGDDGSGVMFGGPASAAR